MRRCGLESRLPQADLRSEPGLRARNRIFALQAGGERPLSSVFGREERQDLAPKAVPEKPEPAIAVSHPCDSKKSQGWGTGLWVRQSRNRPENTKASPWGEALAGPDWDRVGYWTMTFTVVVTVVPPAVALMATVPVLLEEPPQPVI